MLEGLLDERIDVLLEGQLDANADGAISAPGSADRRRPFIRGLHEPCNCCR